MSVNVSFLPNLGGPKALLLEQERAASFWKFSEIGTVGRVKSERQLRALTQGPMYGVRIYIIFCIIGKHLSRRI